MRKKYEKLSEDSCPVVYALRINPKLFEKWRMRDPIEEEFWLSDCALDMKAQANISPETIIGRISFPNGIEEFTKKNTDFL
jgi:hypothetical protein